MSDEQPKLPPLRLTPEGQEDEDRSIRRRAIERQIPSATPEQEEKPEDASGRRIYRSDLERRARTITITFPDQEMMEFLKAASEKLGEERGEEVSPTRLATLILIAGLDLWREGKLVLAKESTAVETIVVKPVKR